MHFPLLSNKMWWYIYGLKQSHPQNYLCHHHTNPCLCGVVREIAIDMTHGPISGT